MTPVQQNIGAASGPGSMGAIHLLLTQGEIEVVVKHPERVMEEIQSRANQVSKVLEGILLEPQGNSRWGLNE